MLTACTRGIVVGIVFTSIVIGQAGTAGGAPHGVFRTADGAVVEDCMIDCLDREVEALFRLDTAGGTPFLLSAEVLDPIRPLGSQEPSLIVVSSDQADVINESTVEFRGEYLPNYGFHWSFTETEEGEVFWSGTTGWFGGRLDLTTMSNVRLVPVPGIPGDYDGSGMVQQSDLDLVLLHWGNDGAPPAGWTNDLPVGLVDQAELDKVLLHWGDRTTLGLPLAGAGVPEPASAIMLLLGVMAFAGLRWRSN